MAAARFAEHHRRGELPELQRVNRAVRLAVSASGVPLIAAMMLFPGSILHLIGPGFEIAATALVIMAVGQLVNCLLPCQDIVLAMTGHGHWLQRLRADSRLWYAGSGLGNRGDHHSRCRGDDAGGASRAARGILTAHR